MYYFYGTHKPSGHKDFDKLLWHKFKRLEFSIQYLFNVIKKAPYKNFTYTIILSKTDRLLSNKISIPNNVNYIYANNINYYHSKIKNFPMGRDFEI